MVLSGTGENSIHQNGVLMLVAHCIPSRKHWTRRARRIFYFQIAPAS